MPNIKNKQHDLVKRSFVAEYRADVENNTIIGMPIVLEQSTDIGGMFEEVIAKGAIDEKVLKDVRFYYNHDLNTKPLARTRYKDGREGTLKLTLTDEGVKMEARVNRERSDANDLYIAIEDGDIDGMSFMFGIAEERWERVDSNYPKRIITKIDPIIEVSAVNYPAYGQTSIDVARSELLLESDKKALESARANVVRKTGEFRDYEIEKIIKMYGGE